MAKVTLKGNEIHTNGELPKVGTEAPDFKAQRSRFAYRKRQRKGKRSGQAQKIQAFAGRNNYGCSA